MLKKSHLLKVLLSILFISVLIFVAVRDNNRLPVISLEHAEKLSKEKKVIFLFRHGERCDRSESPCYSDMHGITLKGADQAREEGLRFHEMIKDYDIYSSNTVRTIQTARFFSGKEPVVISGLSKCNKDFYKILGTVTIQTSKKVAVIMTHNHCLSFLARDLLGKKFRPSYLDALIVYNDGEKFFIAGRYESSHTW